MARAMKTHHLSNLILLAVIGTVASTVNSQSDASVKCSPSCVQSPPPPSPPPPPPACPPPPAPVRPPPSPQKPPIGYCPPPPAAPYIYITGPPGSLYPIDQDFSSAHRSSNVAFLAFVCAGIFGILALV